MYRRKQPSLERPHASFEQRIESHETVRAAIRAVIDRTNLAFEARTLWARPDEVDRMKVWITYVMQTNSVERETRALESAPHRIGYCIYLDIVDETQVDVTAKRLFTALDRAFRDYELTALYKFMRNALDEELYSIVERKYSRRLNNKRSKSKHDEIDELAGLGYPRTLATVDVFAGSYGK